MTTSNAAPMVCVPVERLPAAWRWEAKHLLHGSGGAEDAAISATKEQCADQLEAALTAALAQQANKEQQ